jgi:uncharacterized NAD(P)/FAD-binding protein YdhS
MLNGTTTAGDADLAIVGFGFSGLATLMQLVRRATALTVAVVASDRSGLGLAYRTVDPLHLLNVQANRMGAWAHDPEHFAAWLLTPAAAAACATLGVPAPGPVDFAPRALYAHYLSGLREDALREAPQRAITVRWIDARADSIVPGRGGWSITAGGSSLTARRCVLATGNDPQHVFGALGHPDLHAGPWSMSGGGLSHRDGPVVLIGSGLTAVDSVLTVRRLGFEGPIVALSRNGRLPTAHRRGVAAPGLDAGAVAQVTTLADILGLIGDRQAAGHDCRSAIDALRPHTQELWQRLAAEDRELAVARWGSIWNVHRHRMAPEVAGRIEAELASGRLAVIATRRIAPEVVGERLEIAFETAEGQTERLRAAAVIDCTGPQLDCARSDQPLLRELVNSGICRRHHTGLGLAADVDLQVAEGLYALGSLLTGQLWETVAVPELRAQAAAVAAGVIAPGSARGPRAPSSR